jgi:hypothetical protein
MVVILIYSPPEIGSPGEICLPFEENRLSKVGVRFDEQIPGGIDLGGNCEVDHGLFCSGLFMCSEEMVTMLLVFISYG